MKATSTSIVRKNVQESQALGQKMQKSGRQVVRGLKQAANSQSRPKQAN